MFCRILFGLRPARVYQTTPLAGLRQSVESQFQTTRKVMAIEILAGKWEHSILGWSTSDCSVKDHFTKLECRHDEATGRNEGPAGYWSLGKFLDSTVAFASPDWILCPAISKRRLRM